MMAVLLRRACRSLDTLVAIVVFAAPVAASSPSIDVQMKPFNSLGLPDEQRTVLSYFEDQVLKALEACQRVRVERPPQDRISKIRNWESFSRQTGIEYLVEGSMSMLGADHLVLELILTSFREGVPSRRWSAELLDPLDLTLQTMDMFIRRLIALIEDAPYKEIVYTYCFQSYSHEATLAHLVKRLPLQLRDALEDQTMGSRYEIASFPSRGHIEKVCDRALDASSFDMYEYVIGGEIALLPGGGGLEITVEVFRSRDRHRKRRDFHHSEASPAMIQPLAGFIANNWEALIGD